MITVLCAVMPGQAIRVLRGHAAAVPGAVGQGAGAGGPGHRHRRAGGPPRQHGPSEGAGAAAAQVSWWRGELNTVLSL